MGLDITLQRFLTKEEADNMPEPQYSSKRYFHMDSVLRKKLYDMNMEKFIYKITDTFYDIKKYGIEDEKYKHFMTKFGDNGYPIHIMVDTSHELYPIYEKIQNFITLADTKIEDVNKAFAELNTYADKTIYNFAEMTRNIGTFTAAGVDLEKSTTAIKGIANLAAGSGSNSQQASTAMYQLSQALAAGTVKLQDWNSVVNAGMGGQLFQNELKKTAKHHTL